MTRPRLAGAVASRKKGMTYAEAGVDTAKQRKAIEALAGQIGYQRKGEGAPIGGMSHFAGLVALGDDRALAICTDGVGTKLEVARALETWDTVGIDVIAMNVNDCICVGAEPLAFVDYLAVEDADPDVTSQIGKGLTRGAELANVTLAGGETAIMPEVVNGLDLAGTCVGVVDRDRIVDGSHVRPGDVLIGLASSGLHSNGYTLARRLVRDNDVSWDDPVEGDEGTSWGAALIEPTRIYVRPILKLLSSCDVHALANVTGGGLKNVPRVNPKYRYLIDDPLPVQPVFDELQRLGDVATDEMYRTFNMGMGFVAVVSEDDEAEALKLLKREGERAQVVGRVERGKGAVHGPTGISFASKTGA